MNIKELLLRGRETIAEHCPINNYTSQSWGSCYRPTTIVSTFKGQTWQSTNNLENASRGSFKCLDFRNGADNVPRKYVCKEDKPSEKTVNVSSISGANLFNYTYRSEFGNGKFETGDGYKYRGRGIIQLTWKDHYIEFNNWLESNGYPNKDIITDPDLVATDFELATLSAMWYWKKNDLNEIIENKKGKDDETINKDITGKINSKLLGKDKRLEYQQSILEKLKTK